MPSSVYAGVCVPVTVSTPISNLTNTENNKLWNLTECAFMGIYSLFPPSLRNNQERERKWFSGQGLSLSGGVCVEGRLRKEGCLGKRIFL